MTPISLVGTPALASADPNEYGFKVSALRETAVLEATLPIRSIDYGSEA